MISILVALATATACKPAPQKMSPAESERFLDNMVAAQNASHDAAIAKTQARERTDADAAQNRVDRAEAAH
ncbi:MAG: hypothetical protein H0X36_04175 [Sphingomonadaceae bacterium]|nr:hypothetical protein [Sphingomonadaceae bacterium]